MEKTKLSIKDISVALICALFLSQIGAVVFSAILAIVVRRANPQLDLAPIMNGMIWSSVVSPIMYMLLYLVFWLTDRNRDNLIIKKPTTKKIFNYIFLAVILNLTLSPIVNLFDLGLDGLIGVADEPTSMSTLEYIISIFALGMLPAIFEELLFRGLILKGLKPYGKAKAIILSTIAFALFHLSIRQTLYPILFGLALGLIMYNEDNTVYCMVAHFVNNLTTLTLFYLNITINLTIIYIVLAVVFVVAYLIATSLAILKKQHQDTQKEDTPRLDKTDKSYLWLSFMALLGSWIIVNTLSIML